MRPQIVTILALALSVFTCAPLLGQSTTGGSGPPAPRSAGPPELPLPIDSNLVILIVLGICYGGYIAYKRYRIKDIPA